MGSCVRILSCTALAAWTAGCGAEPERAALALDTNLAALITAVDGVQFGPPLGPEPVATWPFDRSLIPPPYVPGVVEPRLVVNLETEDGAGQVANVAAFSVRSTPALTILDASQVYFVNLLAARYFTDSRLLYRFRVVYQGRELGRADVAARVFDVIRVNPNFYFGLRVRIEARPVPTLTTLTPATMPINRPTSVLTVDGTGFVHDSVVRLGAEELATTYVSSTRLTAALPANRIASPATYDVTVRTLAPGGGTSGVARFEVAPCSPSAEVCNGLDDDCDGQVDEGNQLAMQGRIPVAANPSELLAKDLDGDGRPELIVAYSDPAPRSSSRLDVLRNLGGGAFAAPVSYTLPASVGWIAAGDLDGNGSPDLAYAAMDGATDSYARAEAVFLNRGDGTFGARVDYTGSLGAFGVAIGDADGDGRNDLITASSNGTVHARLNLGGGALGAETSTGYGSAFANVGLEAADFDGDGRQDVLVSDYTNLRLLRGAAGGVFTPAYAIPDTGLAYFFTSGDFDGDGRRDALLGAFQSDSLGVKFGNGDGTFRAGLASTALPGPYRLATGDFDGDGRLDLAATGLGGAVQLAVVHGRGDGTFERRVDFGAGWGAVPAAADLNGDGRVDVAYTLQTEGVIQLLLGAAACPR